MSDSTAVYSPTLLPQRSSSSSSVVPPDFIADHRCSDAEVLQHMLEVESSRQRLERHARELSRLAETFARATRDAQQLAKSKADILATLSHEIRTPLNGILGMAGLLRACDLGPVEQEYVEVIQRAGDGLLTLLDDILDLSKIEADRLELECAEVSLPCVLSDAKRLVQPLADRKGLTLTLETGPGVPERISGDAVRLRQILLNLLSNAIKFTVKGEILVHADCVPLRSGKPGLRFTVVDQGIGISAEAQSRLFQPFTQADPTIARQFGGTGLGLAICKRLAELMGGSIGVTSEPGVGSSFWFTIAVDSPQEASALSQPAAPPVAAAPAPQPVDTPEPTARILLVEDNPINQKVALLMLKRLGLTATLADNGLKGIQAFAEQDFDLVLMDCSMPEMDGLQAARILRTKPNGGGVPIVAMTANAFASDRAACLEAGMSDYLTKPVREAELRQMLTRWLPQHAPQTAV